MLEWLHRAALILLGKLVTVGNSSNCSEPALDKNVTDYGVLLHKLAIEIISTHFFEKIPLSASHFPTPAAGSRVGRSHLKTGLVRTLR